MLGLLGLLGGFEIIFRLSGLLRGFINNGFLFELSLRGFPFPGGITEGSFSLCCSKLLLDYQACLKVLLIRVFYLNYL